MESTHPSSADRQAKSTAVKSVVKFNPFSREFQTNPYPIYEQLRSQAPLHKIKNFTGNEWFLTRFADVKAVLGDPRFGIDDLPERLYQKSLYLKQDGQFQILSLTISKWLFFLNPPDHGRLRTVVSKSFSAGALEGMRSQVQEIVDHLLDQVQATGHMEVMADLACPLPAIVTAKILGIPTPEPTLIQWAHDLFRVFDQPIALENYAQINKVAVEFRAYFSDLIAEKARNPQADLISYLVNSRDQNKLSHDELLGFCAMLFSVGQETTENLIGNSLYALLNNPDQIQAIKKDPTLIAAAIEELLRYDSPVQLLTRVALEDVDMDDQTIQTGDRVHLSLGAANRDPAMFAQPDRLDFERTQQGIPFGGGIHYCLGAALARIQGQVAINTVVQRLAALQINKEEPLEWRKNIVLRGLRTFPVTFMPA